MHRISAASRVKYGIVEFGPLPLIATFVLLVQTALGLGVRYGFVGIIPHMGGAALTTAIVSWAGIQSMLRHWNFQGVRRSAMLMVSFTFSQLLLGIGAYWSHLNGGLNWFPLLHAMAGCGSFAAAIVMSTRIYRRVHPEDEALARGGVAIA